MEGDGEGLGKGLGEKRGKARYAEGKGRVASRG